ncbi:DUF3109 family protein [Tumebacillus permanentifrigoris]|uniref:Uncharacterized protein DUF3109 n=1 Tax=Tumebacillus permanentifrigoris TaxID=378543 RepID=A0A316D735_9BACL|nr:DUF3109 family protein [Tumebacillus permanentifrigoris]PWK10257.1 uncharacterized protein DUF3109 [Tumebacillus permanentifrigoris]
MNPHGYRFIGTPLDLTEGEAYHLRKYWKKGRQARAILPLAAFEVDVDVAALQTLVQLDCAHCHLAHVASCCEGGFPFPPAKELLPMLDEHLDGIAAYLTPERVRHLLQKGLYERHLETAGHQTIGTFAGDCTFCHVEEQGPACMAHRYAVQAGLAPESVKPLSCLLYPLELIESEADGRTLLTALTEQTAAFSRWGADYRLDFICANQDLRATDDETDQSPNIRRNLPADVFALERYRPAYVEGQELLTSRYGADFYKELEILIQGGRRL